MGNDADRNSIADKEKNTAGFLSKLKSIMNKALEHGKFERAMSCISAGCQLLYDYNQYYTDKDFENGVTSIAGYFLDEYSERLKGYHGDKQVVLFYDGFGLDTRGVAKCYLNALVRDAFKVIYVTTDFSKGNMVETESVAKGGDVTFEYINTGDSYVGWMRELLDVIFRYCPSNMIFYTTPYDVSGSCAFSMMDGKTLRYLIDLTDHAFWLGVNSNDYFCGSRELSASNQFYERGIPKEKCIKLGVNLVIDNPDIPHDDLPFDPEKVRFIFSGGQLYKTLGDPGLLYYRIVDHILKNNEDVFFLYAGDGDDSEMKKLIATYPGRAFLVPERKDYYYLIEKCTLYLNTYPMFGGMMMKYSANAGKIPITLRHDNDSDGLLLDQGKRQIEYDSYEELVADVDRLLKNGDYLREREALLEGSIITEKRFAGNVYGLLTIQKTDYEHSFTRIDTTRFREEFLQRFDLAENRKELVKKINKSLIPCFPWMIAVLLEKRIKRITG